jgi:hypothetical protein
VPLFLAGTPSRQRNPARDVAIIRPFAQRIAQGYLPDLTLGARPGQELAKGWWIIA